MSELKEFDVFDADRNPRLLNEKVYLKSEVDAAIDELKTAHHKERHEYINMIAELKEFAEDACLERDDNQAAIDELNSELESLKATAYTESVDAGMEKRRLKRALWLARAERAADRARIFYFNDLQTMLDIDGYSYDSKKKKGHKKLTARSWRIIWEKLERKCRTKAEECK